MTKQERVSDAFETKREISHAEAREIAHRFINSHFHPRRGDGARMTIPADTERDDDLLILSYIAQQERRAQREAVIEECARVAETQHKLDRWIGGTMQDAGNRIAEAIRALSAREVK